MNRTDWVGTGYGNGGYHRTMGYEWRSIARHKIEREPKTFRVELKKSKWCVVDQHGTVYATSERQAPCERAKRVFEM